MHDDFFLSGVWGRSHVSHDSGAAEAKASRAKRSAEDLGVRLDRALLTIEALWSLVRDHLGVTDQDLLDRVVEIDLTDGVLDGKVRRPALECVSCKRRIPRRFARCMYCGVDVQHDPFT